MLKYLSNKTIIVEKRETNRFKLIEKMVGLISESGDKIKNPKDFFDKLVERENIGTTGIGRGIAIPHARCETLEDIVLSIALVKHGIEFDSPDGEPARVVVLIGAPKGKNDEYLEMLSQITRAFRDKRFRDDIMCARNEIEIMEFLADYFTGK